MQFLEIQHGSDLYRREVHLRDRLLRKPLGLGFTDQQLAAESEDLHFGVVCDETLVACLVIVPISQSHAKLRQMVVDDSRQREGIGSRLIGEVEAQLSARGFATIELNARDHAVEFYAGLGYVAEGETFIEVSIPHLRMTKSLT